MPAFHSINAMLNAKMALDASLAAYILLGCLILRWVANVLANYIPATLIHNWNAEVATERGEDFPEPHPSLLRAMQETPFIPPLLRSVYKNAPVDIVQAVADMTILLGPLATLWIAGDISLKSAMVAALILPCAIATIIDKNHFLLPDVITLPTVWVGLLVNSLNLFTSAGDAIWGAVIGYSIIWGANTLYCKFTKQDGIGLGDAKWLAIPGAWFGAESAIHALVIATMLGVAFAITSRSRKIPFGPALSVATLAMALLALSA